MIVITGGAGFIGSCLAWKLNTLGRKDLLIVDDQGTQPPKSLNLSKRQYTDYLEKNDFLKLLSPRPASIHQYKSEQGKAAAELLLELLSQKRQEDKKVQHKVLKPLLVEGDSVKDLR